MLFYEFAKYLEKIESTPSRNEMTAILADLVKEIDDNDIRYAMYLLQGRVAPAFEAIEFNVAEKLMIKALAITFSKKDSEVLKDYKQGGDLGSLVEAYRKTKNSDYKNLDIQSVYEKLRLIAVYSGSGSQDKKILELKDLFLDLPPVACKYIARIPIGKLRLGLSAKTVLDVISWAEKGDKSLRDVIEKAYYSCSDLGLVAEIYKKEGIEGLEKLLPRPGIPVFAKLVERIPTTEEIISKMGSVWAQPKFDGLRCQIHVWRENGIVKSKLFSRNLEDLTEMFPDVVEAAKELPVNSVIIDSEVIGYNPETQEFIPFQKTMNRKRKYEISSISKQIPVYSFSFDVLFYDGQNMMNEPFEKRYSLLKDLVKDNLLIKATETILYENSEDLEKYFLKNVDSGLEGIIVKKEHNIYEPGTRNFNWVKLKRAMKSHLSDTIDVVVMGYYVGKGKRTQLGIGALLMGVYDEVNNEYATIAKVGTGITDVQWREINLSLENLKVLEKPPFYKVDKLLIPDFWVEPKIVSQIRADEITRSPVHTCGKDNRGIGYALRFPRMEIFKRDKLPEDCTTVKEVIELYGIQLSPIEK